MFYFNKDIRGMSNMFIKLIIITLNTPNNKVLPTIKIHNIKNLTQAILIINLTQVVNQH